MLFPNSSNCLKYLVLSHRQYRQRLMHNYKILLSDDLLHVGPQIHRPHTLCHMLRHSHSLFCNHLFKTLSYC